MQHSTADTDAEQVLEAFVLPGVCQEPRAGQQTMSAEHCPLPAGVGVFQF